MEESDKREFKGIWVPARVWMDNRLTPLEKIVLVGIGQFDYGNGCHATNSDIAEFCQCTTRSVSNAVNRLAEFGYVTVSRPGTRSRAIHQTI